MTVSKSLIVATFLLVAVLLVGGVYFPTNPLMWFAGTSDVYQVIRGVILALMVALFLSRPPRSIIFRVLLGVSAAALLAVPIFGVITYQIGAVDAVVFTEVAIILAIEALEYAKKPTSTIEDKSYSKEAPA